MITDGKERIWNEKTGRCSFRTVLYRARHVAIHAFSTAAKKVSKDSWSAGRIGAWRRAYAMRAERERAALL